MKTTKILSFLSRFSFSKVTSGPWDLTITDRCVDKVKDIKRKRKTDEIYLKLEVDGGGCSGFEYKFELVSQKQPGAIVFAKDECELITDEETIKFLSGATVDYTDSMIKSNFEIVQNPRAELSCSCGTSFALKSEFI